MENIRQKLILAASPAQEAECAVQPDSELAHMAYAVSPELRLMRLSGNPPGRGGLLSLHWSSRPAEPQIRFSTSFDASAPHSATGASLPTCRQGGAVNLHRRWIGR